MTRAFRPTSAAEAARIRADVPGALVVAGCTDLMVVDAAQRRTHDAVVDLLAVDELRGIEATEDGLRIGATTTFRTIGDDRRVQAKYPMLASVARTIGGWQIQNRATIGGNIANASPAGDSLPVLLALDARLTIVGPRGARRIPYGEMHTGYRKTALRDDEIVGWIDLPAPPDFQAFRKVGTRAAQAISKVVVALSARCTPGDSDWQDVRVAVGSMAPTPVRIGAAENALRGSRFRGRRGASAEEAVAVAERAADAAGTAVSPIDDVRSTAGYRRHVLQRVLSRMIVDSIRR